MKQIRFEIITPKKTEDVEKPKMACPFCDLLQPDDHIKRCGHEGKLKPQLIAVVYQEEYGKEYRTPTEEEISAAEIPDEVLKTTTNEIPLGIPDEPLPTKERHRAVGSQLPDYGFKTWSDLFTPRQLLSLMTFMKWTRSAQEEMENIGYPSEWLESISAYLACTFDRMLAHSSTLVYWLLSSEAIGHAFVRYALPMTWDFSEGVSSNEVRGNYELCLNKILASMDTVNSIMYKTKTPNCVILSQSATNPIDLKANTIITDPPYYDAIPYADISDFFYVWLRRSVGDRFKEVLKNVLTPKQEELIQQHKTGERGRIGKEFYEKGMADSFRAANNSLYDDGRIVIVFAHKEPDAWETLVKAMIESGLVVTASWPIDTEKGNRTTAQGCAALATSLWLVCRKRIVNARAGHYGKVKRDMQKRVTERLRYFWDAGIRGPDFVWAAIGPALESYSSYKEVRRQTGEPFTVTEFLTEVRRIVTDFALGQILHGASTEALDEWTRYYLMHKDYFGPEDAPVGECILLAQGYGVPLDDLRAAQTGFLKKARSGSALKLLGHKDRTSDRVGYAHTSGRIPMIDMIHRIMKLWDAGERAQINAYFHEHGLQENSLFRAVVQALIETNSHGSSERSLLETLINYEPGEPISGISSSGRSEPVAVQLKLLPEVHSTESSPD